MEVLGQSSRFCSAALVEPGRVEFRVCTYKYHEYK